ncbi:hypothetical protein OS493_019581 [Desmophyllum pertusum]|uniref:Imidazole glycerol phosphate synthase hisHF n=1 Tax=Desmophyllum pertusum TaxID=174260 RepID=A0A9W9ZCE9_9CNID|nr:hypothetical protein OS493_019581 [Desmophyllum pertusum]
MPEVTVLDYGAGNIRSLTNALKLLGYSVTFVKKADDILRAERLIFPGVGAFGSAMALLESSGYVEPLKTYIQQDRPYLGICLGLQTLCKDSEESPGTKGLSVIPASVTHFNKAKGLAVPHMGWNGLKVHKPSALFPTGFSSEEKVYFVHSYALHSKGTEINDWVLATTDYGEEFVSIVQKGNIVATQFHPEKSGGLGIKIIKNFLNSFPISTTPVTIPCEMPVVSGRTQLGRRVIACLDVRSNDQGDLVVTKGEQYDVREQSITDSCQPAAELKGAVRNLGKPVELARRYYKEGADEIVFLNITSFKNCPLYDLPMLEVLRRASENIFVPLTVGGGIRDIHAPGKDGDHSKMKHYTAVEVAAEYFRSGADKVSIGSDAVYTAENYISSGGITTGITSIETIAAAYGRQAVVISVDPKRVYVPSSDAVRHYVINTKFPGPSGEEFCWYQCTVKGGRETRDIGVYEMVQACEALGAGEIMLNSIDKDGTNNGYDLELVTMVTTAVSIPVIASSGAGRVTHFAEVFQDAHADAALAAGIFHRNDVSITDVKKHLLSEGIPVRI